MQKQSTKPVLFLNGSIEDNEAYRLFLHSGVDFELRGPTLEDPTPLVLFRCQRFHGVDEIREFVSHLTSEKRSLSPDLQV